MAEAVTLFSAILGARRFEQKKRYKYSLTCYFFIQCQANSDHVHVAKSTMAEVFEPNLHLQTSGAGRRCPTPHPRYYLER